MIFTPRHCSLLSYQTAKFHQLWPYQKGTLLLLGDMPHSGISPIVSVRIFIYFCMNFVNRLSQKFISLWFSNFHSIFALIRNRHNKLFSLITQPWRHLGAILWFHVIIHIFITIHYKLIKINTHELQVIGQHINISLSACASKFKNAQNHL